MQLLLFRIADQRYALDIKQVAEIAPLTRLSHLPQAPDYIAGVMNYRGEPVPVVDICHLATGSTCAKRMSTRTVLVNYPLTDGDIRVLGLLAEGATEILQRERDQFSDPGVVQPNAPYLGDVLNEAGEMIQLVDVDALLNDEVRAIIFTDRADVSGA